MMDKKKFEALMVFIAPEVIKIIVDHDGISEIEATKLFYESSLYSTLEDEETKLWHLSAIVLYDLFKEEQKTGKITFPEEA